MHPNVTAVIGNACGTIGILHSVANVSAPTGGMVPLRKCCWLAAPPHPARSLCHCSVF
jgi:hypothetical protein